jgi:DNA-directed RNA polymerase specialized sigma subunit
MRRWHPPQNSRTRLTLALLDEFRKTGDSDTAMRLTGVLAPLVYRIARRYQRSGVPAHQLNAVAWSGLYASLAWLAFGRPIRFDTMARYITVGEVSRYVRKTGAGRTGRTTSWRGAGRGSGAGTGEEDLHPRLVPVPARVSI